MRFGSVCSGIEAASVAWHPLGWRASWLSEIEPFPSAVLKHHYPEVPNLGDMTMLPERILSGEIEAPDILCGGTPCQAFSVAGLRKSLDDARGNLSLTFCEIANAIDSVRTIRGDHPAIIFWENVPGVLNTKDNAFGCFLAGLAGEDDPLEPPGGRWSNAGVVCGHKRTIAWRILDAQYFGVAQRRRRVFVVASARNGFDPAAVLFEFDGLRRDTAPSRNAGEETAAAVGASASTGSDPELMATLCAKDNEKWGCNQWVDEGKAVLQPAYGIPGNWIGRAPENGGNAVEPMHDIAPCQTKTDVHGVATSMAVRRLTPTECERLQGFPDGYTEIPWRNKAANDCPDGPRYKALGNSWAVPVVQWIGKRIDLAIELRNSQ
jgi:DNA (cytosine-5)-methyltransferase 1